MKSKSQISRKNDIPESLNLFFTDRCNLDCQYCFVNKNGHKENTLEEDSLKKSVDLLLEYPQAEKMISFSGGEPILEFSLLKNICDYAKKKALQKRKKLHMFVATNGTLLNQKIVDYFSKNNIAIKISLDGSKETHDKNRSFKNQSHLSSFKQIMDNLASIDTSRLNVSISMVFTPETIDNLLDNIKFLNKKSFTAINFYPDLYANWKKNDLIKFKQTFNKFAIYYVNLFDQNKVNNIFKNYFLDSIFNKVNSNKMSNCDKLNLSSSGQFYVCDKVLSIKDVKRKNYIIGNVKQGVNNQKRIESLRKIRDDFLKTSKLNCEKCQYYEYCFCPIGHYIYFSNSIEKNKNDYWKNFCFISRNYSKIFLAINKSLEDNKKYIKIYKQNKL